MALAFFNIPQAHLMGASSNVHQRAGPLAASPQPQVPYWGHCRGKGFHRLPRGMVPLSQGYLEAHVPQSEVASGGTSEQPWGIWTITRQALKQSLCVHKPIYNKALLNACCMQTRPLFLHTSGLSGVLKALLLERNG